MPKTKTPRRSRLIRKWDGTPVSDGEQDVQSNGSENASNIATIETDHRSEEEEMILAFEHETELSGSMER